MASDDPRQVLYQAREATDTALTAARQSAAAYRQSREEKPILAALAARDSWLGAAVEKIPGVTSKREAMPAYEQYAEAAQKEQMIYERLRQDQALSQWQWAQKDRPIQEDILRNEAKRVAAASQSAELGLKYKKEDRDLQARGLKARTESAEATNEYNQIIRDNAKADRGLQVRKLKASTESAEATLATQRATRRRLDYKQKLTEAITGPVTAEFMANLPEGMRDSTAVKNLSNQPWAHHNAALRLGIDRWNAALDTPEDPEDDREAAQFINRNTGITWRDGKFYTPTGKELGDITAVEQYVKKDVAAYAENARLSILSKMRTRLDGVALGAVAKSIQSHAGSLDPTTIAAVFENASSGVNQEDKMRFTAATVMNTLAADGFSEEEMPEILAQLQTLRKTLGYEISDDNKLIKDPKGDGGFVPIQEWASDETKKNPLSRRLQERIQSMPKALPLHRLGDLTGKSYETYKSAVRLTALAVQANPNATPEQRYKLWSTYAKKDDAVIGASPFPAPAAPEKTATVGDPRKAVGKPSAVAFKTANQVVREAYAALDTKQKQDVLGRSFSGQAFVRDAAVVEEFMARTRFALREQVLRDTGAGVTDAVLDLAIREAIGKVAGSFTRPGTALGVASDLLRGHRANIVPLGGAIEE